MNHAKHSYLAGILLLLLLGTACGGSEALHLTTSQAPALLALHGTQLGGAHVSQNGELVTLHFPAHSANRFAQLLLPAEHGFSIEAWRGLSKDGRPLALAVALPNPLGVEIGICPLPTSEASDVELVLRLGAAVRQAAAAPSGPDNQVADLRVADYGPGQVILGWSQVNVGDYDLNNEVNAADLAPIAKNFGQSYNPALPGLYSLPLFWVDGDENGEINAADITAISQHYRAEIVGYQVLRNGVVQPGLGPGQPTVSAAMGVQLPGLPRRYGVVLSGSSSDSWEVVPVDSAGQQGTVSPGSLGNADLLTNLSISGVSLLDLSGGSAGTLAPGKFSSRVIDPIEVVNNVGITQPLSLDGNSAVFTSLPRLKTLFVQYIYRPSVDLATGQSRLPSGSKGPSALSQDFVVTSVPVQIPMEPGTSTVDSSIQLIQNPAGGYFVELTAVITVPGGSPITTVKRLNYASGQLSRDSNLDGVYDDELVFDDDDKDCISNLLVENELEDDDYQDGLRVEGRLLGTVTMVDLDAGLLELNDLLPLESGIDPPLAPLLVRFNEQTEFEDGLTPAELVVGRRLEVTYFRLIDPSGTLPESFWAESLGNEGAADFVFLEASKDQDDEIRVRWGKPSEYEQFILKRFSPRQPSGNYEQDWELIFSAVDEGSYDDELADPGVIYIYRYYGKPPQGQITELAQAEGLRLDAG